MLRNSLWLLPFAALVSGCENDSAEDLLGPVPTEEITYNEHVRPIIQNNCLTCHGTTPANGAPMSLTSYSLVKDAVQTRGLLDRISRPEGTAGLMPNGGPRLPQHTIDIVTQWNLDGLQE